MTSRPHERRFRDTFTPGETIEYDIVEVLHESRSPFQEIAIYEFVGHGRTLVLDGNIQSSEADEHLYHEALVQPALLLACAPPTRALVIGGGEGATLREVLKHRSIERAVMVDLDPAVIAACREHLPTFHRGSFHDPRTELVFADAREYLERSTERFDVIVSDVVDPNEEPAKHLFSREFFELVAAHLTKDGVFAAQVGPAFSRHFAAGARAVAAMAQVFQNVLAGCVFVPVYLSPWGFAFGGETLSLEVPAVIEQRIRARLAAAPLSFDARDLAALLSLPKELRAEIESAKGAS